MPEFPDQTELHDTGQHGLQRFRKPLFKSVVITERDCFELDTSQLAGGAVAITVAPTSVGRLVTRTTDNFAASERGAKTSALIAGQNTAATLALHSS
jgi:hypothetical protein